MSFRNWFARIWNGPSANTIRRRPARQRCAIRLLAEVLEDRTLLSGLPTASGPESLTNPQIAVTLNAPVTQTVTVKYAAIGGTAVYGVDYVLRPGTLTFTPGQRSQDVPLTIVNHGLNEADKTILVGLSSPKNAFLSNTTLIYTILNDVAPPTVSFAAGDPMAGAAGTTGGLSVALSAASGQTVTVAYAVTGGTATAGVDYKPLGGTLTFKPGQTSQTINLATLNSHRLETDQTLKLSLTNPANATLGPTPSLTYTIQESGGTMPTVSFKQTTASGVEGQTINVPVALSAPAGEPVTVQLVTGGTAQVGVDYTLASNQVAFGVGGKTANVTVYVLATSLVGANKTLTLTLASPTNAGLATKNTSATLTIVLASPVLSFSSTSASGPETQNGNLVVVLNTPSSKTVTVHYAATGGTAVNGKDYTLKPNTLTFQPGQTTAGIPISVIAHTTNQADKTIIVTLTRPSGALIGAASSTYTILNTVPEPTVSFAAGNPVSGAEGKSASLAVALSAASGQAITVGYAVTGGTAQSAIDFRPLSGTLTFTPGQTSKTITLATLNDHRFEDGETVQLSLTSVTNATLGAAPTLTYTIQKTGETPPAVSFKQTSASGPEDQTVNVALTLSRPAGKPVTVQLIAGGTAQAGIDYTLGSNPVMFTPGSSTATVALNVLDTAQIGANKTVTLTLASPSNAVLGSKNTIFTDTITETEPALGFDTATPSIGVSGAPTGPINQNLSLAGQVSAGAGLASLEEAVDGGGFSAVTFDGADRFTAVTTLALDGSADGSHTLHLRATDAAGLVGTLDVPFVLDTQAPAITVSSPTPNQFTSTNVTVSGQVADDGGIGDVTSLKAAIDGGSFAPVTFDGAGRFSLATALKLDGTADGAHTIHLQATDQAGNVGTDNIPFTLDTQKTAITVQSPAANGFTNQVTVAGQLADDGGVADIQSLQAAIDGGSFQTQSFNAQGNFSFSSGLATGGAADGHHTIHVKATDRAGNVATLDVPFTLDTVAPSVAVGNPQPGLVTSTNFSITGHATDTLDTVTLQAALDGGAFANVTLGPAGSFSIATSFALDGSQDGKHVEHLKATDQAGNATTQDVTFTLDTAAPTLTVTNPAPGLVTNQNFNITGQATDAVSTVTLQAALDNGSFASVPLDAAGNFSIATNLALNGSQDGVHVEHLKATNQAGTVTTRDVSWTLNTHTTSTDFFPGQVQYTGANPVALATGDINGDGIPDVVTANVTAGTVSVLLGLGNGKYAAPVDYNVGGNPFAVAIGDINGDGKLDVVVAHQATYASGGTTTPAGIAVLMGNGDGTLQAAVQYTLQGSPVAVALGDVNGDGKADIVAASSFFTTQGIVSVLQGNGDGTFQDPVEYTAPGIPAAVKLADITGDGKPDIVLSDAALSASSRYGGNGGPTTGNVAVLTNLGNGTFPGRINPTPGTPVQVVSGDLNGDGIPDLVSINSAYDSNSPATVTILLGKGDGTYAPPQTISLGQVTPDAAALADLNGDGKLDLVVAAQASGTGELLVFQGNGDGTFQAAQTTALGSLQPTAVAVADVNGDQEPDVLVSTNGGVNLLLGNGDGTFGTPTTVMSGNVSTLAVGDINGDGKADLIAALGTTVRVALGNGDGTFGTAKTYDVSGNGALTALAIGDINGDGKADLVGGTAGYGYGGSSGAVAVLLGNGDGTFQAAQLTSAGIDVKTVGLLDANGDGKLDVVAAGSAEQSSITTAVLLPGNGDGTFQTPVQIGVDQVASLVTGDLNGDGKTDVALATTDSQGIVTLLGNGSGFTTGGGQATVTAINAVPHALAIGDINGDGKLDVVTGNYQPTFGTSGASSVAVLLGNGNGTFTAGATLPVGAGPAALALADLNGDGKLDLVAAERFAGHVAVWVGNGDGTFQTRSEYAVGSASTGLAVLDVNGDHQPDVVTADQGKSSITVLLNQGGGTFPGPVQYTGNGPTKLVTGDLNGDGIPDLLTANLNDGTISVQLGLGGGQYAAPVDYAVGGSAAALAIGDINGDGKLDVVVAHTMTYGNGTTTGTNGVAVLLGKGDGTLASPVQYALPGRPAAVALGDINADGKLDIVAGSTFNPTAAFSVGRGIISVFDGNGDGTFQSPVDYGAAGTVTALKLADMNGDSKADIVVTTNVFDQNTMGGGFGLVTGQVTVLTNLGNGTFPGPLNPAAGAPVQVVTGDINGDGIPDLVSLYGGNTSTDPATVSVRLGKGAGSFQAPQTITLGALAPSSLALGDLNGDGKPDIIVAGQAQGASTDGEVLTLLGNGDGSFQTPQTLDLGSVQPSAVVVGDVNGDGILDVLAGYDGGLDVLLGNGDGTLTPYNSVSLGYTVQALALGDVNGDGMLDVAAVSKNNYGTSYGQQTVDVLLGNGDGTFGSPQSFDVATGSLTSIAIGDINGDGNADLAIGFAAQSNYGGGPTNGGVAVLLGNGDGTFQSAQATSTTVEVQALSLLDANGDGKLDVIAAGTGTPTNATAAVLLPGNGDGTFQTPVPLGIDPVASVVTGDFNGDHKPDVALATTDGRGIAVLLGNGSGGFTPASGQPVVTTLSIPATNLAIGDINGDGKLDVVTSGTFFSTASGLSVLLGNGDDTFTAGATVAVGSSPLAVALADLNGDGKLDLVATENSGRVAVWLGNGNGTFQTRSEYAVQTVPEGLAILDVNSDGKPDIITANEGSSDMSLLLGQGGGAFPGKVQYTGVSPTAIATSDLNGDGIPDLVTADAVTGTVSVMLGLGNGQYAPPIDYAVGGDPTGLAIGDVNGDGKPDVIVSHRPSYDSSGVQTVAAGVAVLLGHGDGTLAAPVQYALDGQPMAVAVGDLNGDGKPDIAVALQPTSHSNADANPGMVAVLQGNGDGTFQGPVSYAAPGLPTAVKLADINGDGKLDIVVASEPSATYGSTAGGEVAVLTNLGNGTFPGRINATVGFPVQVISGDLNGDGVPDLLSINESNTAAGATVTVLLGKGDGTYAPPQTISLGIVTPAAAALADLNGDGKLDLVIAASPQGGATAELLVLQGNGDGTFQAAQTTALGALTPSALAIADVNGDHKPDVLVGTDQGVQFLLGNGDGTFAVPTTVMSGAIAALAVGDVNGDGKPDVLAVHQGFGSRFLYVALGNGDGTFGTVATYSVAANTTLTSIALGDVNGDGKPDVLVGTDNGSGGGSVVVLPGNGDGTFGAAQVTATGTGVAALAILDANGDGKLDVVTAGSTGFVLLGNGDGTFQTPVALGTDPTVSLVAGDFNRDGKADVAFATTDEHDIVALLGNGSGGFTPAGGQAVVTAISGDPTALAIGDINGDGKLDIVTANSSYGPYGGTGIGSVSVLLGNGDGTFKVVSAPAAGSAPAAIGLADINGDGRLDLVVTDRFAGQVALLLGNGDGTFEPRTEYSVGSVPMALALLDINGDGKVDIITANEGDSSISVLPNQG